MTDTIETEIEAAAPARPRWPGRAALACGILTLLGVGAGVAAAQIGAFELANGAAWAAIAASGLAVLTGAAAILGNWDRGAGIGGVAIGVLANPLVLLHGLDAVASL